jgi:hypothetical protein
VATRFALDDMIGAVVMLQRPHAAHHDIHLAAEALNARHGARTSKGFVIGMGRDNQKALFG